MIEKKSRWNFINFHVSLDVSLEHKVRFSKIFQSSINVRIRKFFMWNRLQITIKIKKKFNQSNQTDEKKVTLKIKTFSSIWCDAFVCSDALLSPTLGRPARGQVPLAWTDDYIATSCGIKDGLFPAYGTKTPPSVLTHDIIQSLARLTYSESIFALWPYGVGSVAGIAGTIVWICHNVSRFFSLWKISPSSELNERS